MKSHSYFQAGLVLSVLSIIIAAPAQAEQRYGLKSALIEYNITGHIQGKETAYIDGFGEREARYSEYTLKLTGQEELQKRYTLRQDDMLINVDLNRNQSVKFDLNKEIASGLDVHLTAKEMADYSAEGLKKMRAVHVGQESVAGKMCDLYELPFLSAKVWIYKQIALRYVSNTRGFKVSYLATSILEDAALGDDKFELPEGIHSIGVAPENHLMGSVQPLPKDE
ncbi:MAG: hypothetical protein KC897_03095 [Candidatus Omnitrophica bacterium]|nr:hypothetical protein [Candidatus Omnitrophota bacterium]MCB9722317.1 hypothetical protein [Candidatus Omnitrophota bacterium]